MFSYYADDDTYDSDDEYGTSESKYSVKNADLILGRGCYLLKDDNDYKAAFHKYNKEYNEKIFFEKNFHDKEFFEKYFD